MNSKVLVKISVGRLIEIMLQSGDISYGFKSSVRAIDGIKAHQIIQKSRDANYQSEYSISCIMEDEPYELEISGRIDGIIQLEDETILEEIKTIAKDFSLINENEIQLHLAQAKCYGYMYCKQQDLSWITIHLTYYQIMTKEIKTFKHVFIFDDLEIFFDKLAKDYLQWFGVVNDHRMQRDQSIKLLSFPYPFYRIEQRSLAVYVYKSIRDSRKLFTQAPTGIGKTMATLFPAIKSMGEGLTDRIFYLTAKTITHVIAETSLDVMRQKGLIFKSVTITAKEKICFKEQMLCDPLTCEYAKGHYDRVKDALKDIFKLDAITRNIIVEFATKHGICPFEFSLDIAEWSDCIICDYNYIFDPRVYLRRFFTQKNNQYTFLIDEAHNLVDRSREMFSAQFTKKAICDLKNKIKSDVPKITRALQGLKKFMVLAENLLIEKSADHYVQKELPKGIATLLGKFITNTENWLSKNIPCSYREELLSFYFMAVSFQRTCETYDEHYITYYEKIDHDIKIKLFCLDPSFLLQEVFSRSKSAILFSATLTPLPYFMKILGGDDNTLHLCLPSPFPRNNFCVLLDDRTSTRYAMRSQTYDSITESIYTVAKNKAGNYLAFFPSYQYMKEIFTRFMLRFAFLESKIKTLCQQVHMTEEERENFLNKFAPHNEESLVGFAVMGGIFSEGIDLTGDRLSGAIIVGVSLPQLCLERNIIKNYFDKKSKQGFEYAYTYPGMNKVLQSVGRVIRSEKDRGVVLLIDDRFSTNSYRKLFPQEWNPIPKVRSQVELNDKVHSFWADTMIEL